MNVKDPLWNAPKPATNVSSPSGLPKSTTANDMAESYRTITTANNNARALSTLKPSPLVQNSTANATTSAANTDTSGLILSDVNATIIAALANQPSSHLWSFRQYWYIAVAVTAATIFFPLAAGPVVRATIRFSYRYKGYWRIAVFLLGLSVALVMDAFIPEPWLLFALGIPQGLVAGWNILRAHFRESHKKRWFGYISVLMACIAFDVEFPSYGYYYYSDVDGNLPDSGSMFGLTGILPPAYLFVVWVQTGKPLLSRARWDEITARLPRWLVWVNLPRLVERREDNKAYTGHQKLLKGISIAAAGVCNGVGSYFIPGLIYPGLVATPLILYSLDKLINSFQRQRHRRRWTFFAAVVASSTLLGWYTWFGRMTGSIGLFPTLTLWAFANEAKVISILRKYIPTNRSSLLTATAVNPDPGTQMTTLSSPRQRQIVRPVSQIPNDVNA
jgi:MFS family permease